MCMMAKDQFRAAALLAFIGGEENFVPCCMASVYEGPDACNCWEPVFDQVEAAPVLGSRPGMRTKMCDNCAFRPDSPERRGHEGYANNSPEDLEEIVGGDAPFYCHKGMRRIVRFVHPTGAVYVPFTGFDPQIWNVVAYKANGQPADICAGFAAARLEFFSKEQSA